MAFVATVYSRRAEITRSFCLSFCHQQIICFSLMRSKASLRLVSTNEIGRLTRKTKISIYVITSSSQCWPPHFSSRCQTRYENKLCGASIDFNLHARSCISIVRRILRRVTSSADRRCDESKDMKASKPRLVNYGLFTSDTIRHSSSARHGLTLIKTKR